MNAKKNSKHLDTNINTFGRNMEKFLQKSNEQIKRVRQFQIQFY